MYFLKFKVHILQYICVSSQGNIKNQFTTVWCMRLLICRLHNRGIYTQWFVLGIGVAPQSNTQGCNRLDVSKKPGSLLRSHSSSPPPPPVQPERLEHEAARSKNWPKIMVISITNLGPLRLYINHHSQRRRRRSMGRGRAGCTWSRFLWRSRPDLTHSLGIGLGTTENLQRTDRLRTLYLAAPERG